MFGLMKCNACSQTTEQKLYRRLHYCGTCRAIGGLYGRKSRVLLNSDAVFLGEVLSAISNSQGALDRWDRSHKFHNCLSQPKNHEDMPLALQFAATAVLIIAEFKLEDRIADSDRNLWKLPYWIFSKNFLAASTRLKEWGFPLVEIRRWSHVQAEREAELKRNTTFRSPAESLIYLAEPTAVVTGLFFEHGTRVVGNQMAQRSMYLLGHAFGSVVYWLDAFEDYEKDFKSKDFNALRAAYDLSGNRLSSPHREWAIQHLWKKAAEIESALEQLPISTTLAGHFFARLKANLAKRLDGGWPALDQSCVAGPKPAVSFRARSRTIVQLGKSMIGTLVLPRHARAMISWREAFNLVFPRPALSHAGGSAIQFSSPAHRPYLSESTLNDEAPDLKPGKKSKRSSRSSWCCCGDCDCSCCCDCGACCDC